MTTVFSPVTGKAIDMAAVPDQVFAQGMVGPGAAIDPARKPGDAVSPIDGTVHKLHPHAFVILGPDGRGVLVHLGIDTVQLSGEGFTVLAAEGDTVTAGQPVINWDPAAVEAGGRSPVVPVVALDAVPATVTVRGSGDLSAGDDLFDWQ